MRFDNPKSPILILLWLSKNRLDSQLVPISTTGVHANLLLRLEIPMDDVVSMAILYRTDHLLEESPGFTFGHLFVSSHSPQQANAPSMVVRAHPSLALLHDIVE